MSVEYREQLMADAVAGNPIAERLLLLHLLASDERDAIESYLNACTDSTHQRFLKAELCCFHGWPGSAQWQDLLRECAEAGHKEASLVVALYHDWARFCGQLANDNAAGAGFDEAWTAWHAPAWHTAGEGDGLLVEISAPFAPEMLIRHLRAVLGPQLRRSAVIDPQSGQPIAHPVRVNRSAQWLPEQLGWIGKLFECRLAAAGGYRVACGEVSSLLHYTTNQHYKPHHDCINPKVANSEQGLEQGGQRTHTLLLALGDAQYSGGDTFFPHLELGVKTAPGEIMRFNNVDAEGQPLRESIHQGQPVSDGEKWILSKWVRERTTPFGRELCIVETPAA